MLDQTFSSKNFMTIYEKENRMGNIPKESMSSSFQNVVEEIQEANKRLHELRYKKKLDRTDDDVLEILKSATPFPKCYLQKRNGLLIRKTAIKSSRPFHCAYHPLTP